jgi:hypothetical protein
MFVRLWFFTERPGDYPEGGTYDTSVFDDETGNCSDARQFVMFQDMMEYSNAMGEALQEVSTPEEAYAICSENRINSSPGQCTTGYTNESTFVGAMTRPIASRCVIPTGGGSRNTPPPICPPNEPVIPPTEFSQPRILTQMDNARRIIRLARQNRIVPTIVF